MKTEKLEVVVLPEEVQAIAKNVSSEKQSEVQSVLNKVFNGVAKMREQIDLIKVEDENDKYSMDLARTSRLSIRQERLEAEKTFNSKRAEVQQEMLSFKTEDSLWLKAKQVMQIITKEQEEIARWKEETAKRFEAEQKELVIQQRINSVAKFLPEMERSEFESMSEETFKIFIDGVEKDYNQRIVAEKKAEEERIAKEKAQKAEQERIRLENKSLKKAAEEKAKSDKIEADKKIKKVNDFKSKLLEDGYIEEVNGVFKKSNYKVTMETLNSLSESEFDSRVKEVNNLIEEADKRAKIESDRLAKEAAEKKEREAKEAKEKAEHEAQLKVEREKAAKIQAELEAKENAEKIAKADEAFKLQAELSKGDSDKVKDLIKDLTELKTKYSFKSEKNQKKYEGVGALIEKVITYIKG